MDEVNIRDAEGGQLDHELEVIRWRTQRLHKIGYELREAARLVLSRIDIHELEQLVGRGCPLEIAVRIVA
jgi:hypothetical protein